MKLGMLNKVTIVNRFVLHALHRNFTLLTTITHKTTIKIENLKGGGGGTGKVEKSQIVTRYHK